MIPEFNWLDGVFAWVTTFAVHSTVLLSLALVFTRILPRGCEALCEWIWKTAMFGGLLTTTAQFVFVTQPVMGHLPSFGQLDRYASAFVIAEPDVVADAAGSEFAALATLGADVADADVLGHTTDLETLGFDALLPTWDLSGWLLFAMIALAVLGVGLDIIARFRLSCRLQGRRPVSTGVMPALLTELGVQAGFLRAVRLTRSSRIRSPIAFGVLWPEICVPDRALIELSAAQQKAMLAHELAHICRNDPVWLRLGGVLQCLFPWQLLFRAANRGLQTTVELRCDSQAARWLGGGVPVAQCLVEVASWLVGERRIPVVAGLPAMAEGGSVLNLRVDRLLSGAITGGLGWHRLWLTPSLTTLLLSVAVLAPGARWPAVASLDASPRDVVEVDRLLLHDVVSELIRLLDEEREVLGSEVAELEIVLEGVQMTPDMHTTFALLHAKLAQLDARRAHFQILVTGLLDGDVTPATNTYKDPRSLGKNR